MRYSFSQLPTTGKTTINTRAVQILSSGTLAEEGIQILANSGNSAPVWVGFATGVTAGTVNTTDGFPLEASQTYFWRTRHIGETYVISSSSGQVVHWSYI